MEGARRRSFLGNGRDTMRYLTLAGAGLLAALFVVACDDEGDDEGDDAAPPPAAPQQTPPATQ
jgi:hypothetical protein